MSPRRREALLLAAAVGAFIALGAIWLWRFRRGQPVDIDEAGYLSIAINDYRGLADGGPTGLWDAVMGPSIWAPLMTALTTPVFAVTGPGILPGLLVPLLLGGVMLLATHGLGHEIGGPRVAWVAFALTAGAPVVIGYSRTYNFAIASGAAAAVMLWAIARSRTFDRRWWSVAAGAAIGCVALSRTLTLAFLPSLVLVGLVALAFGPARGRRAVNLLLAAAVSLVVAGPWYYRNGEGVFDYLTSYGYGKSSTSYGDDQSLLSLESYKLTAVYTVQNAGVPIFLLWLFGAVAVLGSFALLGWRSGLITALVRAARSPLMPGLLWATWGMAALTTSGNKGTGFIAPLVPAFAMLTAWAVWRTPRPVTRVLAGVTAAALLLNTVVTFDPRPGWAQTRFVDLPWLDDQPLYSASGVFQNYVQNGNPNLVTGQLSRDKGGAWHRAQVRLASELDERGPALTVFGFRHRLLNINTVQLEQGIAGGTPLPMTMVDPVAVPNDEKAMTDYLVSGGAATACVVLTARGRLYEIEPVVDAELMAKAARAAGFVRDDAIELPDQRTVVVWRRPSTCPVASGLPQATG